jgi:hypothetical protein
MTWQKDAFLVKLWCEAPDHGEPPSAKLRGSVEHLPTHQRRYFSEIVDLITFLTTTAGNRRLEDDDATD